MTDISDIEKRLIRIKSEIDYVLGIVQLIHSDTTVYVQPINVLNLPTRVFMLLKRNKIHTIPQLENVMSDTVRFKETTHGVGWATVYDIQLALKQYHEESTTPTPRVDEDAQS